MFDESLLHRMKFRAVRQSLYRPDLSSLGLDSEHQARSYRLIVQQHRARAANAMLTPDMRARATTFLAQCIDECAPRLYSHRVKPAVDLQCDIALRHLVGAPGWDNEALALARARKMAARTSLRL